MNLKKQNHGLKQISILMWYVKVTNLALKISVKIYNFLWGRLLYYTLEKQYNFDSVVL